MTKNKGKFGKGKAPVETDDQFVSGVGSIAHRLKPYAKRIALVIGGIVVVVAVYSGWNWYKERKEAAATKLFDEAVEVLSRRVLTAEDRELFADTLDPAEVTYDSYQERSEAALTVFNRLRSEYGSTRAAKQARLMHAGVLFDLGKYGEAADIYRAFAGSDADEQLRVLAREGYGYALEAQATEAADVGARKAGLEAALEAFVAVQPKEGGYYRDYALYHQGRILAKLDRRDDAIARYREVLDTLPQSSLKQEIEHRLTALGE